MDWKILSPVEPIDAQTGALWIKPGNRNEANSAFWKLGAGWVQLATNDTVTFEFEPNTILIDGRKLLPYKGTLNIDDILTKQVDTCSFSVVDIEGNLRPAPGQELLVFPDPVNNPLNRFGGIITDAPQVRVAPGKYAYSITASDYSQDMNRRSVVEVYENVTAGYIIRDIIKKYAPAIGTLYVEDGPVIAYKAFNYQFPADCIDSLCVDTGYDWYVDSFRNVHFFDALDNPAPYTLTDDPNTGWYSELEYGVDKSQLRNLVTVRGGYQLSKVYTDDIQIAIAGQKAFSLKYTPFAPVTFWLNGVQKSCGIDNVDESGFDFVVNVTEKLIKCLDHAPLSAGDVVNPHYTYQEPIIIRRQDNASILAMQQIEGGDGIYEAPLIIDDTLATSGAAVARAQAELFQYANPFVKGSFKTVQSGYRSGQTLTINIPSRNINAQVLIQEVSASAIAKGQYQYTVTFATKLKGLLQFLVYLFNTGQKSFGRTDEIVENLMIAPSDGIMASDIVPTCFTRDPVAYPYLYDNDAGTIDGAGRYDLCSYGE